MSAMMPPSAAYTIDVTCLLQLPDDIEDGTISDELKFSIQPTMHTVHSLRQKIAESLDLELEVVTIHTCAGGDILGRVNDYVLVSNILNNAMVVARISDDNEDFDVEDMD